MKKVDLVIEKKISDQKCKYLFWNPRQKKDYLQHLYLYVCLSGARS